MWPEFCITKDIDALKASANHCNSHYYEKQCDQDQSAIDNAVMTKITPFLYLGMMNVKHSRNDDEILKIEKKN
jgi:hypothetical protein